MLLVEAKIPRERPPVAALPCAGNPHPCTGDRALISGKAFTGDLGMGTRTGGVSGMYPPWRRPKDCRVTLPPATSGASRLRSGSADAPPFDSFLPCSAVTGYRRQGAPSPGGVPCRPRRSCEDLSFVVRRNPCASAGLSPAWFSFAPPRSLLTSGAALL